MRHPLLQTIWPILKKWHLKDKKILLSLSGGVDSMVLLHCLHAFLGKPFTCIYIDHQQRKESALEALKIQHYAERLGHTFLCSTITKACDKNPEETMRLERYHLIKEAVDTFSIDCVFVAHHKDDLQETLWMRLIQGAKIYSLTGLKMDTTLFGMRILRPMLGVSKSVIMDYAEKAKIPFFYDTTNDDTRFLRNQVRHSIFPFLDKEFDKNYRENLADLALQSEKVRSLLESLCQPLKDRQISSAIGLIYPLDPSVNGLVYEFLIDQTLKDINVTLPKRSLQSITCAIRENKGNVVVEKGHSGVIVDKGYLFIVPDINAFVFEEVEVSSCTDTAVSLHQIFEGQPFDVTGGAKSLAFFPFFLKTRILDSCKQTRQNAKKFIALSRKGVTQNLEPNTSVKTV